MIFLLLLLPLLGLAQDFTQKSFTTGARTSYFTDSNETDNSFFYYIPEYSDETFGESVGQRRKLKVRIFDYVSSDEPVIIDPLDVSLEFFTNNNSFQVGFLRYRFSETFGLQLLDVANPRDYSEYIFNDLAWAKRSVFGINDTYKWNNFSVQLILTLWPNGDRLPYQGSAFDPTEGQTDYRGGVVDRPWFKDLEYGSRIKYLMENGVDLSFLYYHHFSRPTFQDIKFNSATDISTSNTEHMVDSFGSSASYVLNDWVLRGDFLFTKNDLIQKDLLSYTTGDHTQLLAGIDRTYEDFLVGLQTQHDLTMDRHFFGVRGEWSKFSFWKPSVMLFKNYAYYDQWFQFRNDFQLDSVKMSLTYDNIQGNSSENALFGFYRKNDRVLADISFTY